MNNDIITLAQNNAILAFRIALIGKLDETGISKAEAEARQLLKS